VLASPVHYTHAAATECGPVHICVSSMLWVLSVVCLHLVCAVATLLERNCLSNGARWS